MELPILMRQLGLTRPDPLLMEVPQRVVDVDGFYLDSVEVTNRAFAAFVAARPERSRGRIAADYSNDRYLEGWSGDRSPVEELDHPVTFATWWAGVGGRLYAIAINSL